jgi:hypothetical protein
MLKAEIESKSIKIIIEGMIRFCIANSGTPIV